VCCGTLHLELRNVRYRPVSNTWLVVPTADDTEEAMLTPVCAPTVTTNPVVYTILSTPAIQLDGMISVKSTAGVIHVDTTGIVLNAVGIDIGRDWSTSKDLGHDIVIAFHGAILADGDLGVLRNGSCYIKDHI